MVIDRFFHGNFHRIQLQLGKFSMKMETRLETSWDARPSPSQATSYTLQDKLIIFGYHLYGNPPNFDQGKYHRIGSIGIVLSLETMVCTIKKKGFPLTMCPSSNSMKTKVQKPTRWVGKESLDFPSETLEKSSWKRWSWPQKNMKI